MSTSEPRRISRRGQLELGVSRRRPASASLALWRRRHFRRGSERARERGSGGGRGSPGGDKGGRGDFGGVRVASSAWRVCQEGTHAVVPFSGAAG